MHQFLAFDIFSANIDMTSYSQFSIKNFPYPSITPKLYRMFRAWLLMMNLDGHDWLSVSYGDPVDLRKHNKVSELRGSIINSATLSSRFSKLF